MGRLTQTLPSTARYKSWSPHLRPSLSAAPRLRVSRQLPKHLRTPAQHLTQSLCPHGRFQSRAASRTFSVRVLGQHREARFLKGWSSPSITVKCSHQRTTARTLARTIVAICRPLVQPFSHATTRPTFTKPEPHTGGQATSATNFVCCIAEGSVMTTPSPRRPQL